MTVVEIIQDKNVVEINNVNETVDIVSGQSVVEIVTTRGIQGVQGEKGDPGTSGGVTFETTSRNLLSYPATLNYTNGDLTSIVYDLGGGESITKTLAYAAGKLETITLSGDTPAGIDLVKTLTYTGDDLTGVAYS